MQVATVVSVFLALVALAAGDEAAPSLRGDRAVAEGSGSGMTSAAEETHEAAAGIDAAVAPFNGSESMVQDLADLMALARNLSKGSVSEGEAGPEAALSEDSLESMLLMRGGWAQGGDKLWGSGSGMESISSGNVGYYNKGMYAARSRCGGPNCALITNPAGHRTVHVFHIHFVHYGGYGANLKRRLEKRVCGKGGWHGGGLPCHGKAAFFRGFPGVFSKAMSAGGIRHASVIAWPSSCGGRGTIVEVAYGCSIEHQIRGDYNPRYR